MINLEMLLLRRKALLDLVTECEVELDQHFTEDPDPVTTLQALIEDSGGLDTPVGRAAEPYQLRLAYRQRLKRLHERLVLLREQRARNALPKLLTTTWSGAPPKLLTTTSEPIRPIVPLEIGTPACRSGEFA